MNIPTSDDLQHLLHPFHHKQLQVLASTSGVPFTTLWKIRVGEVKNPGIDTVRKFLPGAKAMRRAYDRKQRRTAAA